MFIIILTILFLKIISEEKKIVVIPFTRRKINYNSKYNSTNFLSDNIFNNILLDLNIGIPQQKVQSKIDHYSDCFIMETYNEESLYNKRLYSPISSTSIVHVGGKYFHDTFNFEGQNESHINFWIPDYTYNFNYSKYNYTPVLGTKFSEYKENCPNFFLDIKKKALIKKLIQGT